MSTNQILIFDALTGETITRAMTAAEISQFEADKNLIKAYEIEAETKAKARQAVLSKLGLTQDEANALLS